MEQKRLIEEMEAAAIRDLQPGDSHEEQTIMTAVGNELRMKRKQQNLSLPQLSSLVSNPDIFVYATEEDLELAEQGLVDTAFFFAILSNWSGVLNFDASAYIHMLNAGFERRYQMQFGLHRS